jgi:hypothetical protein
VFWTFWTKAACKTNDKGKPATKFYSSRLQIVLLAVQNCLYSLTVFVAFTLNICTTLLPVSWNKGKRVNCSDQTLLSHHHSSITRYTILLPSPIWPWTQDHMQQYNWVTWAYTVNQTTKVYLSLVDLAHWHPSKTIRTYTHRAGMSNFKQVVIDFWASKLPVIYHPLLSLYLALSKNTGKNNMTHDVCCKSNIHW